MTENEKTVAQKVQTIKKLMVPYNEIAGDSLTGLADLLADILHYCKAKDVSFNEALEKACGYYEAENEGP